MRLQEILRVKGSTVYTTKPESTLDEVIQKLVECNCGSLVVCDGESVVGIITERDILRASATNKGSLHNLQVKKVMSTNLTTGTPADAVEDTMGLMTAKRIRHLPILKDGKLAGMISIGDVVKAHHDHLTVENHYLKSYIHG